MNVSQNRTQDITQEITHEIGARGSLSVRNVSGEIRVRGVPGGRARVLAHYRVSGSDSEAVQIVTAHPLKVTRESDGLQVEAPSSGRGAALLRGRDVRVDFEVEVPFEAESTLSTVSGSLVAGGLHGRQHYATVSGDARVSAVRGEIEVRTVSGDVRVTADAPLALEAATTSGDLHASAPVLTRCRVTSVSGDVSLEAALAPPDEHAVETVSGDLRISIAGGLALSVRGLSSSVRTQLPHRSQGSGRTRILLFGDGTGRLTFRTVSGEAQVDGSPTATHADVSPPVRDAGPQDDFDAAARSRDVARAGAEGEADLAVLQALERGEIDVEEAARLLSTGGATGGG